MGGLIYGLKISKNALKEIAIVLVLTTLISTYMVFKSNIGEQSLSFLEGAILVLIFAMYVFYTFRKKNLEKNNIQSVSKREALYSFLYFSSSILVVLISGSFVVESAINLAVLFGVGGGFIGATIIAIGTSLPEISIDLQAIRKGKYMLAIGDAIGSNMINITLVLGTAATINPISLAMPVFVAALIFAVVANILLLYSASINKSIGRVDGLLFLLIYVVYLATIFYLQINNYLYIKN